MCGETVTRGPQRDVWMEAGKGEIRSVSCENPEVYARRKGRSESTSPKPHPRQANRAEKRTAKATGPEAPRTRGHGAGAPLTPPLTRAHGPLGTSNHWAAPRTRGPPLPAGNCLFTQSLLPIILIMIDYATGSNIMQSNKRKVWKGSW